MFNFFYNYSNKGKARRGVADGGPDDDGDYATLRELPLMSGLDPADDSTSEENKVSSNRLGLFSQHHLNCNAEISSRVFR